MSYDHESDKPAKRIAEPVQVYLDAEQRARLERLAAQLDTSKSGVLRQALEALEREVTNPDAHPAIQLIGLAAAESEATGIDPARDHDAVLADGEEECWNPPSGSAGG
jgi:predicted transcriptional regulator